MDAQDLLLQLVDKPKQSTQEVVSTKGVPKKSVKKKKRRPKVATTSEAIAKRKLSNETIKPTKKMKITEESSSEEDEVECCVDESQGGSESSLNCYLQHELTAREDLVNLKCNYKLIEEETPFSKGTSLSLYKRVEDPETLSEKTDLFEDYENFEKRLVEHHGVDASIAAGLASFLNKNTEENKKVACKFADALFSNMSVVDMTNLRPCDSKLIKKFVYMAKILNLAVKSRELQKSNNNKLKSMTEDERFEADFRDRGLVKPASLILLPHKKDAYQLVNDVLLPLIKSKRGRTVQVENHKRFKERCGLTAEEEEIFKELQNDPQRSKKPEDFKEIFGGNCDDDFIVPIKISPNKVKLYTSFYQADIIIASPLALRQKTGHKTEKHHDSDFLASLQTVVVDEADVINMQNWTNLLQIYKLFHLKVTKNHNTDINRIHMWALAGHSKHYCQHVVMSAVCSRTFGCLLLKHCHNHKGLMLLKPDHRNGSISDVTRPILQHFYQFRCEPGASVIDARFDFFESNIFKDIKEKKLNRVLVYCGALDYLRLRDFFNKKKKAAEGVDFEYFNEYSEEKHANKLIRNFVKGKTRVMLYSERYHFNKRPYLKGIEHVVFYDVPAYPRYYSELVNMVRRTDVCEDGVTYPSVRLLYHAHQRMQLEAVLGRRKAADMAAEDKDHVIFCSKN